MNACDVIGYAYDAAIYCPDCLPDGVDPEGDDVGAVFADSETDCPTHCDACGEYIPESLTDYGVRYVLDSLDDWRNEAAHGRIREAGCLETWADALGWYGLNRGAELRLERFTRTLERVRKHSAAPV